MYCCVCFVVDEVLRCWFDVCVFVLLLWCFFVCVFGRSVGCLFVCL